MVLFVCFEAREGNGILGQGTMRWGAESSLGAGVFLLLRQNQWAFLILPNSENSPFRSVFKFLVYWFILTETKGVHLLRKKNKSEKKKDVSNVSKKKHGQKEVISGTTWL